MAESSEWIAEGALATALNVERGILRAKRPYLLAGEVQEKNGAVLWQKNAAERVAGELGLALPTPEETSATGEPAPPPEPPETLIVICQAVNRNIVHAQRASGERVAVRVTNNKKFLPRLGNGKPMTLQAQKSAAGNWWVLVGREPRWAGVW